MHRRLVACRLVDPDTFRMEASDGTVWLHRVERDEQGSPVMEQIHRWMNLIWAPPAMDEVLLAGLGSNPGTVVIPGTGDRG
jgi:hypothetical protein